MIRRIISAVVVVGAVVGAAVIVGAGGPSSGKPFRIALDNAFGLTKGGDLRVGGVKAGQTTGFKISKGPECQNAVADGPARTCAIVSAQDSEPGFKTIRTEATCNARQQSLVGEYYLSCQPANATHRPSVRTTI